MTADRSFYFIVPFVLLFHFLFFFFLGSFGSVVKPPLANKKVIVKTVKLSPVKEIKPAISHQTTQVKNIEKPSEKLEKPPEKLKKVPEKAISKESAKPVPKKQPVKTVRKEEAKPVEKKWVAEAKEKIRKISSSSDKMSPSFDVKEAAAPSSIEYFSTDIAVSDGKETLDVKEAAYRDELAHRLKLYLKLPEYGDVKIVLTLERSGKVAGVKVISTQSKKNAAYIEKQLPALMFPSFGGNFSKAAIYDFTLVLSNE